MSATCPWVTLAHVGAPELASKRILCGRVEAAARQCLGFSARGVDRHTFGQGAGEEQPDPEHASVLGPPVGGEAREEARGAFVRRHSRGLGWDRGRRASREPRALLVAAGRPRQSVFPAGGQELACSGWYVKHLLRDSLCCGAGGTEMNR